MYRDQLVRDAQLKRDGSPSMPGSSRGRVRNAHEPLICNCTPSFLNRTRVGQSQSQSSRPVDALELRKEYVAWEWRRLTAPSLRPRLRPFRGGHGRDTSCLSEAGQWLQQ